jgi:hypothetical protein
LPLLALGPRWEPLTCYSEPAWAMSRDARNTRSSFGQQSLWCWSSWRPLCGAGGRDGSKVAPGGLKAICPQRRRLLRRAIRAQSDRTRFPGRGQPTHRGASAQSQCPFKLTSLSRATPPRCRGPSLYRTSRTRSSYSHDRRSRHRHSPDRGCRD